MAFFGRNKKGALELSITAIVVLIIAITVLGLAIFFIKSLFKGGTEIFTGELAKIKDQLRKNIEESGDLVVLSAGSEIEAKRGTPQQFYVGIKNTEARESCFKISIKCIQAFSEGNTCPNGDGMAVGGYDLSTDYGSTSRVTTWFPVSPPILSVKPGDVMVAPLKMQIPTPKADTYQMELAVYKVSAEAEEDSCIGLTDYELWQTKGFYIILS